MQADFSNDGDNEFLSTNPVLDIRLALENGYIEKIAFKFKTLSTRYDEFVNDTIRDYLPSQIESVSSSERVKKCQNFYCGHSREVNQFDMTMALGVGSPNSCAKVVEDYWHEHGKPEFKVKDFKIDDIIYDDRYPDVDEFLESLK